MTLYRVILFFMLFLTLSACNQTTNINKTTHSNYDTLPKTSNKEVQNLFTDPLKFIPAGYVVLDTASGDLNVDGMKDLILILKKNGEDTSSNVIDHPEKRPLLIILRTKNGFKLEERNDNTVYCIDCGGMMGDPYMGVTIKNGYFSVEHYGGSAWRWTRIITYRYSNEEKDWFLYKDGSDSFHASEPEKIDRKIKTTKDFGKVNFTAFNIYKEE